MHIALHGSHHHLTRLGRAARILRLNMRLEDRNSRFHRACGLDHLWQKHLSFAKESAHFVHTIHQRTLNHIHGMRIFGESLINILLQKLRDTLAQGIFQSVLHRFLAPFRSSRFRHGCTTSFGSSLGSIHLFLDLIGQIYQFVGSTLSAVEHHILDEFTLFFRQFRVILSGFGIYDTEVHTHQLGMMKENSMDSLADISIATEGERKVAHTTAHMGTRQMLVDPFRSADKLHGIVVVLLHTRSDGQHVWIEDDVERIHAHLIHEDAIGPLGNLNTAFESGSLPDFIETHHHHGSSVSHHITGVGDKLLLTFLERDRVDDALTLTAFQSGNDDIPFRRVNHDRHLGNLRFSSYHIEEVDHLHLGIQQTVVHVDIHDSCPVGHLLAGDIQRLLILFFIDESEELTTTRHIASLTHIDES